MTACVNKNYKRRAAGVVTASLAGALTLGGVSLAVATPALAAEMELQAAGKLSVATLSEATDDSNAALSVKGTENGGIVTIESTDGYLVPTVLHAGDEDIDLVKSSADYVIEYSEVGGNTVGKLFRSGSTIKVTADGTDTDKVDFSTSKAYTVKVTHKTDDDEGEFSVSFKYAAEAAKTVKVYDNDDEDDTTFTYNGGDQKVTVKVGNTTYNRCGTQDELVQGAKFLVLDAKGGVVQTSDKMPAGNYSVKTSDGQYVPFTVGAYNLAEQQLVVADKAGQYADLETVKKGLVGNDLAGEVDATVTNPKGGTDLNGGTGLYTVTLKATDDASKSGNVTGSKQVTYHVLDKELAGDLYYGSSAWTASAGVNVDLGEGESFDASKIKVKAAGKTYSGDQLEVSYYDTVAKKAVDASALKEDGAYEVTVKVKAFQDDFGKWVGKSFTAVTATVKGASVDADKAVTFTFDGKVCASEATPTYDGTDQLKKLAVSVKGYEQGKDYALEVKDENGKAVDSIVDANSAGKSYTVTVKPTSFKFQDASKAVLKVTVGKQGLQSKDSKKLVDADAVAYTGSAVEVPALQYKTGKKDAKNQDVYATLDKSLYKVTGIKYAKAEADVDSGTTVKELKEAGYYKVTGKLTVEGAKNFDGDIEYVVQVREFGHFTDVPSGAWYSKAVETAYDQLYINGISGTQLFAPEADITRADAVGILFNMAGGENEAGDDFSYSEDKGYDTGFNDVDGKAYYAKGLAWAHKSGVVNGDGGDFRPADKVTRQEFAAMLFNYAKSTNQYKAAEGDALSKVSDADTVSAWATEAVNWAVSNKVMGNGGSVNGGANISRAEVAAMAVNFQPKNLTGKSRQTA